MPLEQVGAVAVALYCTGEVTVEPATGLLTVTVANAAVVNEKRRNRNSGKRFMIDVLNFYFGPAQLTSARRAGNSEGSGSGNECCSLRHTLRETTSRMRVKRRSEERRVGKECRSRWSP